MRYNEDLPNLEELHFILWYKLYLQHRTGREFVTTSEAYELVANHFGLSEEQKNHLTEKGYNDWQARVRSSYDHLKGKGIIQSDPNRKGYWKLTDKGIETFEEWFPPVIPSGKQIINNE
ncbi:winged helix-turn-helix domain-containing protein [Paenibacillus sp. FSL R7-0312]|uniref:winged helix-turn-helix domain-containing protein n=1 Tax=Paenibacillus sp. FSL R7-0312 TaxID=2921682 RepID=UPI0030F9DC73